MLPFPGRTVYTEDDLFTDAVFFPTSCFRIYAAVEFAEMFLDSEMFLVLDCPDVLELDPRPRDEEIHFLPTPSSALSTPESRFNDVVPFFPSWLALLFSSSEFSPMDICRSHVYDAIFKRIKGTFIFIIEVRQ